jgi:hypothetical protein
VKSRSLFWAYTICLTLLTIAADASPMSASEQAALIEKSDIIFLGTVTAVGTTSFSGVPSSATTIVVTVSHVLKKPAAVSLKKGDRITVDVKDLTGLSEGTEATFYTVAWILGSGVAVREVERVVSPISALTQEENTFTQAQNIANKQLLAQRLAGADVVIVGSVLGVRPATSPTSKIITEHDPEWREAVIQVRSVIKGTNAKEVVVRFPASQDIAWANSPKLRTGEKRVFLLKTDQVSGSKIALLAGENVTAYTALSPDDVLPPEDATQVRSVLQP